MAHDTYARPPREAARAEAAVTRRSLLGIGLTPAARDDIDYDAVAARVRAAWSRPGSGEMLRAIEPVAEVAAELAGGGRGSRVLDVERRGAEIGWAVADTQSLPFADASYDAVVSTFGATLAPRPEHPVAELARVARPGGIVIVCAWIPRGLPGRLHEFAERLDPLPDGVPSPAEWGRQSVAESRLAPFVGSVKLRTRTVRLRFADPDSAFRSLAVWTAIDLPLLPALRSDFDRLLASCDNGGAGVEIDARYLIALGRRPGASSRI